MCFQHGGFDGICDLTVGVMGSAGLIFVSLVSFVASMPVIQRRMRNPILLAEGSDVCRLRFLGKPVFDLLRLAEFLKFL